MQPSPWPGGLGAVGEGRGPLLRVPPREKPGHGPSQQPLPGAQGISWALGSFGGTQVTFVKVSLLPSFAPPQPQPSTICYFLL